MLLYHELLEHYMYVYRCILMNLPHIEASFNTWDLVEGKENDQKKTFMRLM